MINYELSRGCPYNCTYCANGALKKLYKGLGRFCRSKPVEQSISELEHLVDKHGFDFVRFWDEDFTALRPELLAEYAEQYIARINLPFIIFSRADSVTEEKVRILKEMGCRTFAIGIESGNEHIRRNVLNRQVSNRTIVEKIKMVKEAGIRVSAYNMMGFPQENRARIFDTIELNRAVKPDTSSCSVLEPYRGTPVREMCEAEGMDPDLKPKLDFEAVRFVPWGMTEEELRGLFRTFHLYIYTLNFRVSGLTKSGWPSPTTPSWNGYRPSSPR
ncbi:MAG: radical SAM protein [Deltaproteobacteria bacterium]|nr:radical SAM protein [Deltaproteobacteria bacterium]